MKITNFRVLLSALCMVSILAGFTKVTAGPVRFDQVVQVINARPERSHSGDFTRLRVAGDYSYILVADDDEKKKAQPPQTQDDRVITETRIDVVRDDVCDCEQEVVKKGGFPKYLLLGLAAIPIIFLITRDKDKPTPTQTVPTTLTPTPTMTTTPTPMTPTPTPPMSPTPTPPPEPIPEPMTILLFGTGLASVGLAARRRLGRKRSEEGEKEAE